MKRCDWYKGKRGRGRDSFDFPLSCFPSLSPNSHIFFSHFTSPVYPPPPKSCSVLPVFSPPPIPPPPKNSHSPKPRSPPQKFPLTQNSVSFRSVSDPFCSPTNKAKQSKHTLLTSHKSRNAEMTFIPAARKRGVGGRMSGGRNGGAGAEKGGCGCGKKRGIAVPRRGGNGRKKKSTNE